MVERLMTPNSDDFDDDDEFQEGLLTCNDEVINQDKAPTEAFNP